MKKIILIAATIALISSLAQAEEFDTQGMFYIKVPFGHTTNKAAKATRMGFRMDYSQTDNLSLSPSTNQALFDYRFANNSSQASMKINGVEVIEYDYTQRADGGTGSINWWVVGAAVTVGAIAINESGKDDDDEPDCNITFAPVLSGAPAPAPDPCNF